MGQWGGRYGGGPPTLQGAGTNVSQPKRLSEEDFSAVEFGGTTRGRVSAKVLIFDSPGHRLLPINDELIDRALTVQTEFGRRTFVNYEAAQVRLVRSQGLASALTPEPLPSCARRAIQPVVARHSAAQCTRNSRSQQRRNARRRQRRKRAHGCTESGCTESGCTRRTRCTMPPPPDQLQRQQSGFAPAAP